MRWLVGIALALIVVVVLCVVGCKAAYQTSEKTQVLYVKDKESVAHNNDNQYRVYTDKGVYGVEDSLMYWNWRAGDRYNEIEPGRRYRCFQAGWRIGFLSMFPNLLHCEALTSPSDQG